VKLEEHKLSVRRSRLSRVEWKDLTASAAAIAESALMDVTLNKVDFSSFQIMGPIGRAFKPCTHWTNVTLVDAVFKDVQFASVWFKNVYFYHVRLCDEVYFKNVKLENVTWTHVELSKTTLRNVEYF